MKKTTIALFGMLLMGISSSQAQTNRVGINTETPSASLDIKEVPIQTLPDKTVVAQGVSFPNFSTKDRDLFTAQNIKEGTMIYNTDKHCLEIYSNIGWLCVGNNNVPPTSIPDITVRLEGVIAGDTFNIPYTGRATGYHGSARIFSTLSDRYPNDQAPASFYLSIPANVFSGNDGGNITAYIDSNYSTGRGCIEATTTIPVNIHGLPSFNVNIIVPASGYDCSPSSGSDPDPGTGTSPGTGTNYEPEKKFLTHHINRTGILLRNGEQAQIEYTGKMTGSYGEIRKTMTTTHVKTTDGNHENVTLVIPAGTFSGEDGGTIPAYFEVDGDGVINAECMTSDFIKTDFIINGIQGIVDYDFGYTGC